MENTNKTLYIRFGNWCEFWDGDQLVPDGDPLNLIDEDGEMGMWDWSREVVRIARERGFTHIFDQNLAEDGLLSSSAWSSPPTIEEYDRIVEENYRVGGAT